MIADLDESFDLNHRDLRGNILTRDHRDWRFDGHDPSDCPSLIQAGTDSCRSPIYLYWAQDSITYAPILTEAVNYATNYIVDTLQLRGVMTMSWGHCTIGDWQGLHDELDRALDKGMVLVAAAGNSAMACAFRSRRRLASALR